MAANYIYITIVILMTLLSGMTYLAGVRTEFFTLTPVKIQEITGYRWVGVTILETLYFLLNPICSIVMLVYWIITLIRDVV